MQILNKDILSIEEGWIAHGVNCQNAMGSGVAKVLYKKWPIIKVRFHERGKGVLGYVDSIRVNADIVVHNCYTQEFYGRGNRLYASISAIETCLRGIVSLMNPDKRRPLYLPAIGCGLGGLAVEDLEIVLLQLEQEYSNVEFILCIKGETV